jgi:hypothetical protein
MTETKNGNGFNKSWIAGLIIQLLTVAFAAGACLAMLRAEGECNKKQDVKLEQNDQEHRAFERNQAITVEQLRQINEKLGDIQGRLRVMRVPE